MYTKIVVILSAIGFAAAGNLLHAQPLSYSAPAISAYAAAPVIAKTFSPAVSYSNYAAPAVATYSAPAFSTYAAAPVVAKTISPAISSVSSYSSHTAHAAPIVAKTIASPAVATYAAPAYSTYAATPVVHSVHAAAPVVHSAPIVHVASPAFSTYADAPILKSAVAYSAAPAVSHVSYTSLGANYGW